MAKEDDTGYPGMFNFQEVMNKFYDYTPDKDDDFGNAVKQSFASNMVQSAFDKEMAKEMGLFQNALGQANMKTAADLELANNSAMMQQEFNYGMQSMGAQFDFQNQFSNAQFDRDIAMTAAQGEDTRKTQDNAAYNNRLQEITQQEQSRLTDTNKIRETTEANIEFAQVQGGEQRLTDTNKSQNLREEMKTQASEKRLTDTNQLRTAGEENRALTQTQGTEARLTDSNKASENRTTMDFQNRLESKTRAEQSKYARNTARAF
jgi:hypothetical protein